VIFTYGERTEKVSSGWQIVSKSWCSDGYGSGGELEMSSDWGWREG